MPTFTSSRGGQKFQGGGGCKERCLYPKCEIGILMVVRIKKYVTRG